MSHQRLSSRDENQDGVGEFGFLAQLARERPRGDPRSSIEPGQAILERGQEASTEKPAALPTAFKECDPNGYVVLEQAPEFDAALDRKTPGTMASPPVATGLRDLSNDGLPWKLSAGNVWFRGRTGEQPSTERTSR